MGTSGSAGVSITGVSNVVEGNFIGTDAAGDPWAMREGVIIANIGSNTIGGTAAGSGNTIGFSSSAGVSITGSSAKSNVLEGNFIGTNAAGANLGNALGVVIDLGLEQHSGWDGDGGGQHDRIQRLGPPADGNGVDGSRMSVPATRS